MRGPWYLIQAGHETWRRAHDPLHERGPQPQAAAGAGLVLGLYVLLLHMSRTVPVNSDGAANALQACLVFAFAATFTPSPDPLSMLLLAVPCLVLVEASEVFAWGHDKRKARLGSLAYPGLSEDKSRRYRLDQPVSEHTPLSPLAIPGGADRIRIGTHPVTPNSSRSLAGTQ